MFRISVDPKSVWLRKASGLPPNKPIYLNTILQFRGCKPSCDGKSGLINGVGSQLIRGDSHLLLKGREGRFHSTEVKHNAVVRSLANGNLDGEDLEHYCAGPGICCADLAETKRRFEGEFVDSLAPSSCQIFSDARPR